MKLSSVIFTSLCLLRFVNATDLDLDPAALYCVHGTNILLKNSTAVAGASTTDAVTNKDKLHEEGIPEIRQTLHHCIGGVVTQEAMVTLARTQTGIPIPMSSSGHEGSRYAYIEPLSAFLEARQVFGGQVHDVMTTTHTYGSESTLVIPAEDAQIFKAANPDYVGTVCYYDINTENLRSAVERIFKEKGLPRYNLRKVSSAVKPSSICAFAEITQEDTLIPVDRFERCFSRHNLFVGVHSGSPFKALENALMELRKPLIYHAGQIPQAWHQELTSAELKDLKLVLGFLFSRFFDLCKGRIDPAEIKRLEGWREDCLQYLRLATFNSQFKSHKSIFYQNEKYKNHVQNRATVSFAELDHALPEIPVKERMKQDRPCPLNHILLGQDPQELIMLAEYARDNGSTSYLPAAYILKDLFCVGEFLGTIPEVVSPNGLRALELALQILAESPESKDKKELIEYMRESFWHCTEMDQSAKSANVLRLLNTNKVGPQFRAVLGMASADECTFEQLLLASPQAEVLKPGSFLVMPFCGFLQTHIRNIAGSFLCFRDFSCECNSLLMSYRVELQKSPLKRGYKKGSLLRRIEDGEFGSLHDIFSSMGLGEKFRQLFPTDDDFWKFKQDEKDITSLLQPNYSTFGNVFRKLQTM
jgi:hypothetical protein